MRDLTGCKFGRLRVIKPANRIKDAENWICKCDCGKIVFIDKSKLIDGEFSMKCCGDCLKKGKWLE